MITNPSLNLMLTIKYVIRGPI